MRTRAPTTIINTVIMAMAATTIPVQTSSTGRPEPRSKQKAVKGSLH